MMLAKLALKNLTRHKRRVIITSIILSFGIALYLFSDSIVGGISKMSFDNLINLEIGHMQIMTEKQWDNREDMKLDYTLKWNDSLKSKVESVDGIQGYMSQIRFGATLNNGIDEIPVVVHSIDIKGSKDILELKNYVGKGRYLKTGQKEVIMGKKLADLMDFKLDDYATFVFKTTDGAFNTIDAKIVGLLNTPNPTINNGYVYIPLDTMQNSLNAPNEITSLVIRTIGDKDKSLEIGDDLRKKLNNSDINLYTWEKLGETIVAMVKQQNIENGVMMFMFLTLASIGVVNTIFLSSLERTKEIGMMKALGFKKSEIMKIFMIEAAGIGFVGSLIGIIIGIPIVYYSVEKGISMGVTGDDWGMPIMEIMYGIWRPTHFIWIFIGGIIISVIASYFPANWAAKKDPVETIEDRPI